MNCQFNSLAKGAECLQGCGRVLKMDFSTMPVVYCPAASSAGDALEELLTSYGITKEWWTEYKSQHGLPPNCGCDSRREYLNDLSKAHPNLAKYGVMAFRALTRKKP
jgi:hypothetical protein